MPVSDPQTVDWTPNVNAPAPISIWIGNWNSGVYFVRLQSDDGRIGFAPFVVAPALHFLYAAVADVVRAGVVSVRYLIALALAHYAAIAYVALATADGRDALLDADPAHWRAAGVWVVLSLVVFIVWQVALVRSIRRQPPMVL